MQRVTAVALAAAAVLVACRGADNGAYAEEAAASQGSCGNGICNPRESCRTCPVDCGVCPPVCGDGSCNGTETCSSCPVDCGACPSFCGDGSCNASETCDTCSADCGACPPACSDGICNGTETCSSCPADCGACPQFCGDGSCTGTETCSTCAEDCGSCPDTSCTTDLDCYPVPCCYPSACTSQAPVCGPVCNADNWNMNCACINAQCAVVQTCGDHTCTGTETCETCPDDCGGCG